MNQYQLNRILNLVKKTGDKLVVADREGDRVFVVMDFLDYEELQGIYQENDTRGIDFMSDIDTPSDIPEEFLSPEKGDKSDGWSGQSSFEEDLAKIRQDLPFSGKLEGDDEDWEENSFFPHILEEKDDLSADDLTLTADNLAKKQENTPFFTPLGEVIRNKNLSEISEKEPILEEINQLNEEPPLHNPEEQFRAESDLSGEDEDRFYLEPV